MPSPPNNVAKGFVDVYLFPTFKKGVGEVTLNEGRGEFTPRVKSVVNFHVSQQRLSMIV